MTCHGFIQQHDGEERFVYSYLQTAEQLASIQFMEFVFSVVDAAHHPKMLVRFVEIRDKDRQRRRRFLLKVYR
jgi:predicted transcriptional regulator